MRFYMALLIYICFLQIIKAHIVYEIDHKKLKVLANSSSSWELSDLFISARNINEMVVKK